jgi:hypothetical protein
MQPSTQKRCSCDSRMPLQNLMDMVTVVRSWRAAPCLCDVVDVPVFAVSGHDGRWSASAFCVRELPGRAGIRCIGIVDEPESRPRALDRMPPVHSGCSVNGGESMNCREFSLAQLFTMPLSFALAIAARGANRGSVASSTVSATGKIGRPSCHGTVRPVPRSAALGLPQFGRSSPWRACVARSRD